MKELTLIEMFKYVAKSLLGSKVIVLFGLEFLILMIGLLFSKIMNKKVVKITCIFTSLIVFGFYIVNYTNTMITFINNVSTKLVELIYFPTTLEFVLVMFISFIIMIYSIINKKTSKGIKVINTIIPIAISFLFLCVIEYINTNNVAFDEFSVFTNPILMSLNEVAMGLFISWILGLIVCLIDIAIIKHISLNQEEVIVPKKLKIDEEEIEMPRLKNEVRNMIN